MRSFDETGSMPEYVLQAKDFAGILFGPPARRCRSYIRLGQYFRAKGYRRMAQFVSLRLQAYGLHIARDAIIHATVKFPHPTAIVIGNGVTIEEDVVIFQCTTIGGARMGDWRYNRYPSIGAGSVVYAGSVIVGKISIGKNCVVGANSVVLSDIPDGSVCVGAPARVISKNTPEHSELSQ